MCEYKIVTDSSCELPKNLKNDSRFVRLPFRMEIDGKPVRDGKNLDMKKLLNMMAGGRECRGACPSPDLFLDAFQGEVKRVYVITISSRLSGCYNSAMLAKRIYEQDHNDKEIIIIDSRSASGGECLLALKAMELEDSGMDSAAIKSSLMDYRDRLLTYMVLDDVNTLCKRGAMSRVRATLVNSLNIKPILKNVQGEIVQAGRCIGLNRAWNEMTSQIASAMRHSKSDRRRIVITHCNNRQGAEQVRKLLMEKTGLKDIIILGTSGLSSLYAANGGIIVAY